MLRPDLYDLPKAKRNADVDAAWSENYWFYFNMGVDDGLTSNLRYSSIQGTDNKRTYLIGYKQSGGKIKSLKRNQAV